MTSFPAAGRSLAALCITSVLVAATLLGGCSRKNESGIGADGKPHFTKGPGVPADVLARANAYRQQHQGQSSK